MSDVSPNLDDVLAADPEDVGCDAALEVLDRYVEAGLDAAAQYPGASAHLRSCPACRADYEGLRAAAAEFPGEPPA
jgi:hypothetical protein